MDSKVLKSIRNFILLILIAWFVKTTILEIYVVPTGSMFNTIEQNDLVVGNKFIYGMRTPNWIGVPFSRMGTYIPYFRLPEFKEVQNGDITVFEFPYDDMHKYVKRTIGLPKQYVEIKDGKISIGKEHGNLVYRPDLTFPEKSLIKKEIETSSSNNRVTEKSFSSFQNNKYSELFSYYKPVAIEGTDFIDRENIKFQVPFKGMKINLNDESVDLYSTLMILLQDGYEISLKDYSVDDLGSIYNLNQSEVDYSAILKDETYVFHKSDNEQMFDTSMTIWGFVSGIPIIAIMLILLFIGWKLYLLYKDIRESKFSYTHAFQISLYGILIFFILYLSNVDIAKMRSERQQSLISSINNDLDNSQVSLKDFFQYTLSNYRGTISNGKEQADYDSYKAEINETLTNLIQNKINLKNVGSWVLEFDCEAIHSLNLMNWDNLSENEQKGVEIIATLFNSDNDVASLLMDYYNYKNIYDYNMNIKINKKLKNDLFDNILVDGIALSDKSDYVLRHNYYFMVGDNRNNSSDSRYWGFVPDYHLLGQPVVTLANFGKFQLKFDVHL